MAATKEHKHEVIPMHRERRTKKSNDEEPQMNTDIKEGDEVAGNPRRVRRNGWIVAQMGAT